MIVEANNKFCIVYISLYAHNEIYENARLRTIEHDGAVSPLRKSLQ